MKQPLITYPNRRHDRGFSIISAIFLLVVIAGLSAAMLTIGGSAQRTANSDILGDWAHQAAKTGVEWGLYQVTTSATYCAPGTSGTLPALPGQHARFTVSINCSRNAFTEGSANFFAYAITATAVAGIVGSPDYLERQVRAVTVRPQ